MLGFAELFELHSKKLHHDELVFRDEFENSYLSKIAYIRHQEEKNGYELSRQLVRKKETYKSQDKEDLALLKQVESDFVRIEAERMKEQNKELLKKEAKVPANNIQSIMSSTTTLSSPTISSIHPIVNQNLEMTNPMKFQSNDQIRSSTTSNLSKSSSQSDKDVVAAQSGLLYEHEAMKLIQRIVDEETAIAICQLPANLESSLDSLRKSLDNLSSSKSTDATSFVSTDSLLKSCQIACQYILDLFNHNDTSIVKKGVHSLFSCILSFCKASLDTSTDIHHTNRSIIKALSFLIAGLFQTLSGSQRHQLSWRLQAFIYRESCLTIPKTSDLTTLSLSMLHFQMYLIGLNSVVMDVHYGWTWIVRACQLLHTNIEEVLIMNDNVDSEKKNGYIQKINHLITCIYDCLNIAGISIYKIYHHHLTRLVIQLQTMLKSFVDIIKTNPKSNLLLSWIDQLLSKQGSASRVKLITRTVSYGSIDIHTFQSILDYRLDDVINVGLMIDLAKPKPDDIKEKLAYYRINRLQGMFNRLNTEPIKHEQFADEALEIFAVVQSAEGETSVILRYLLFKLVNLVIANSQEETVLIKKKNTTYKLSRVSSLLCKRNGSLKQWFVHQFHRFCPLTIPWILEDADYTNNNSKVLEAMDFLTKDGKISEKKDKWSERMIKTFVIFSQIIIQDEQTPFDLADGFAWLASITNAIPRLRDVSIAGEVIDVFLRITSEKMLVTYGEAFMKLLVCIQQQLIPILPASAIGTQRLSAFLSEAISSNGRKLAPIYEDT